MSDFREEDIYTSVKSLVRLRYTAQGFSYLPRQPVRSLLSGRKRSRLRGRGLDFDELRHYRPGDDIRTMDWRVTNRTGKPHVRVYIPRSVTGPSLPWWTSGCRCSSVASTK